MYHSSKHVLRFFCILLLASGCSLRQNKLSKPRSDKQSSLQNTTLKTEAKSKLKLKRENTGEKTPKKRANTSKPTQHCTAHFFYQQGKPIQLKTTLAYGATGNGICITAERQTLPVSVTCDTNGKLLATGIEDCTIPAESSIQCEVGGHTITKENPFVFRFEADATTYTFNFLNDAPSKGETLQSYVTESSTQHVQIGRKGMATFIQNLLSSHSKLILPNMLSAIQNGEITNSPLGMQRTACLLSATLPINNNTPSLGRHTDSITDECFWQNPFAKQCLGKANIKNFATFGQYHPAYLANWKGQQQGYPQKVSPLAQLKESQWTEYEIRFSTNGRTAGAMLLPYDKQITKKTFKHAASYKGKPYKNYLAYRNYQNQENQAILRELTGSRRQTLDKDLYDTLYPNLLISGAPDCAPIENTQVLCLPSPLRIHMLAPYLSEIAEDRAAFRIRGYEKVEIKDLILELLPSRDIIALSPHQQCSHSPEECELAHKESIEDYFFVTHNLRYWSDKTQQTLSTQSSSSWILTSLFYDRKMYDNNGRFDCDGDGQFETATHDGKHHKKAVQRWDSLLKSCPFPYTRIWNIWQQQLDMEKQIRRLGIGFLIADNHYVDISNVVVKGITKEGMFQLLSNEFVELDGLWLEGISAQHLKTLGFQVDDPKFGFSAFQKGARLDETFYMGSGITLFNGGNSSTSKVAPGAQCCVDPKGNPIKNCAQQYYPKGLPPKNKPNPFSFTNQGPESNRVINNSRYTHREYCVANTGNQSCTADSQCPMGSQCHKTVSGKQIWLGYCLSSCQSDADCESNSRCVGSVCKSSKCDTQFATLTNSTITNCTSEDFTTQDNRGLISNDDGVSFVSTSGLIFNNHFSNFNGKNAHNSHKGCNSMMDLAQRLPCARQDRELHRWLRVERNRVEGGVIKNVGTSEPESGIVYANNEFLNVQLVDYHQKWRVFFLHNTWLLTQDSTTPFFWGQYNRLGSFPWQAPYYGAMFFNGNLVRHGKKRAKLFYSNQQAVILPGTKLRPLNNSYIGQFSEFYRSKPATDAIDLSQWSKLYPYDQSGKGVFWTIKSGKFIRPNINIGRWEQTCSKSKTSMKNLQQNELSYQCFFLDEKSTYNAKGYQQDLQSKTIDPKVFDSFSQHLGEERCEKLAVDIQVNNSYLLDPRFFIERDVLGQYRLLQSSVGAHNRPKDSNCR